MIKRKQWINAVRHAKRKKQPLEESDILPLSNNESLPIDPGGRKKRNHRRPRRIRRKFFSKRTRRRISCITIAGIIKLLFALLPI